MISAEQKFLFDIQGYVILSDVLSADECRTYRKTVEESLQSASDSEPVAAPTKVVVAGEQRLNGLLRQRPEVWSALLDHPGVLPYLQTFLNSKTPQLVHSWAMLKHADEQADECGWHRGVDSQSYSYHDGVISCQMANVLFALTDNLADDGGLMVVPGSHKSNMSLGLGDYGINFPGSQPLLVQEGDVVIFSEGLLHSPIRRMREGFRMNAYFNFVHPLFNIAMRSPENLYHFYVPKKVRASFSPQQQRMLQWMNFVNPPRL